MNDILALKSRLGGHSRSSEMTSFESFSAVSYSHFAATVAVSVAGCEIFSVKKWRDLENWVWGLFTVIENGVVR